MLEWMDIPKIWIIVIGLAIFFRGTTVKFTLTKVEGKGNEHG